jgi:DNA-binding transcriptional MerR regulator
VPTPGLLTTAAFVVLAPVLAGGLIAPQDIVIVAASGTSGAGPSTLRDWESQGIIQPRWQGKRRRYSTADVDRVLAARELRRQSFSPAAIAATMAPERPDSKAIRNEAIDTGRILRQARLPRARR